MSKKLVLILNPTAGQKQGKRFLADIITAFEEDDYACLVCVTRQRGEATGIAIRYAEEADLIVAIGGDGTLNEVISGLIQCGVPCPIGYIPAGSTNDLGNSLGLSRNLLQAADGIIHGRIRGLDIGCFNGRYFTYTASFGAFTRASYSAPQNLKNLLGHLAYLLEGVKDLLNIRPEHLRIETDDGVFEGDYLFGTISNSTSLGGVLSLDESLVQLDDGLFELLLISMPANLVELNQIISALTTQKYDCDMISFRSVRRARILCSAEMPWTLDGEYQAGVEEVLVENLHRRIQIVLPTQQTQSALPGDADDEF